MTESDPSRVPEQSPPPPPGQKVDEPAELTPPVPTASSGDATLVASHAPILQEEPELPTPTASALEQEGPLEPPPLQIPEPPASEPEGPLEPPPLPIPVEPAAQSEEPAESTLLAIPEEPSARPEAPSRPLPSPPETILAMPAPRLPVPSGKPAPRRRSKILLPLILVLVLGLICVLIVGFALINLLPDKNQDEIFTGALYTTTSVSGSLIDPTNSATAIKSQTPARSSTPSTTGFRLQFCSISEEEDVCIYSIDPQAGDFLTVALNFRQPIDPSAMVKLYVEGDQFNCSLAASWDDRLFCTGTSVVGNTLLEVFSSTGSLLGSGTFDIPEYVPPAPTPRNTSAPYYP